MIDEALPLMLLVVASLVAGVLNSIVGGGSLLTFPALLGVGLSPVAANVTNSVGLAPGLAAGMLGARSQLAGQRRRAVALVAPTLMGGVAGASVLLASPESAFEAVVPLCILTGTVLVAAQPRLQTASPALDSIATHRPVPAGLYPAAFVLAIYSAYFGAGYGVLMLPVLSYALCETLPRANALRLALSFAATVVTVAAFGLLGPVHWPLAAILSCGLVIGGYAGAMLTPRVDPGLLRRGIVTFGVFAAATTWATSPWSIWK